MSNKYIEIANEIGKLVGEKQKAYGDSFGRAGNVLREMYPKGIKPDQYDDALCIVRIIDKLFRIANQKDAFGESPYKDIVGYGLLGTCRDKETKEVNDVLFRVYEKHASWRKWGKGKSNE